MPYERLLGDAIRGDATLFAREDSVEAAWRIIDPILGNATGEAIRTAGALQDELRQQMLRQVDWARTMVSMKTMEVKTVVELGPGRVLASLAAKHIPGVDTWNAEELFVELA